MIHYATYRLGDGTWRTTTIFGSKEKAKEAMKFLSEGKDCIIMETEEELERRKKERDRQNEKRQGER